MSAVMSLVSSFELQQYAAKGPFFFAMGTDFGSRSTFSRSVFNAVKGAGVLLSAGTTGECGKKSDAETAASGGMDGAEEGPGTGWECDTESTDCNKY